MSTSEILNFAQSVESYFKAYKNELQQSYEHYVCLEVPEGEEPLPFEIFAVKELGKGTQDQELYDNLSNYMVYLKNEMEDLGFTISDDIKGYLEIFMTQVYDFGYEKVCSLVKD